MPEPTAPCACDKCVEKGNSIEDCESFGMDCDCVQTTTPSQTTTEQGTTTPEPTTVQTTTTPKSTTPAAPCACDKCVELGNSIDDCKLFGMDCDCVQTTTPAQTTTEQGTTTPESTTEQSSSTLETTTEQGNTTPEATTEQASTTPEPTTVQATTPPKSTTPAAPCACDKCVELGNYIEDCESFGMDCDCVQTTTPSQTTTEQ